MKGLVLLLLLLGGAATGWYVATPRSAVEGLREAIHAGDAAELEERIAFDSVRAHLKTDLRARLRSGADPDDAVSTIGAALGGLFADGLIDLFVSPRGLALVMMGRVPDDDAPPSNGTRAADYTIDRQGPNRFVVHFERADEAAVPVLEFRRSGLNWRMVRIRIAERSRS